MTLPAKALFYRDLSGLDTDPSMAEGAHSVKAVQFREQGQLKKGYFKPLGTDYTLERAKYVVLTSILLRMTLGESAAEERLVYKKTEGKDGEVGYQVVGTLSYAIPNFKHMAFNNETLPEDPAERDRVAPGFDTLLTQNIAAILIANYRWENDDLHPGNLGTSFSEKYGISFGIIDFDRFWSKGAMRGSSGYLWGTPRQPDILDPDFLDNFPIVKRGHMPTNLQSISWAIAKTYLNCEDFRKLAGSEKFHQQMMTACLLELLMYQPSVIKQQLITYLGEEDPFIEKIMPVLQEKYDEFYRAVVFYKGCWQNKQNATVPSFQQFLRNTPSALNTIMEHVTAYNKKMQSQYPNNTEAFQISEQKLTQHFRQIQRDSNLKRFREISLILFDLVTSLEKIVYPSQKVSRFGWHVPAENMAEVTKAEQLVPSITHQAEDTIVDTLQANCNNALKKAFEELCQFREPCREGFRQYLRLERDELTEQANQGLHEQLNNLQTKDRNIRPLLGNGTTWQKKWDTIIHGLKELDASMYWAHGQQTLADRPMCVDFDVNHKWTGIYKNSDIVKNCMQAFFAWVDKLKAQDFKAKIMKAVQLYEPPISLLYNRSRGDSVRSYIEKSQEKHSHQLAWILSQGEVKTTSLNTLLIQSLFPIMLQDNLTALTPGLTVVRTELEEAGEDFDWEYYSRQAQQYAKNLQMPTYRFFAQQCFTWARKQSRAEFNNTIENNIFKKYEKSRSYFGSDRRQSIGPLLENGSYTPEMVLAVILKGSEQESNLTNITFDFLWEMLKAQASIPEHQGEAEWDELAKLQDEHKKACLDATNEYFTKQIEDTPGSNSRRTATL